MAVFIGATRKTKVKVFRIGKPYKVGNVWAQDIFEIIDGNRVYATNYAYKKGTLSREMKSYPLIER